jgi:hypothetical protein
VLGGIQNGVIPILPPRCVQPGHLPPVQKTGLARGVLAV